MYANITFNEFVERQVKISFKPKRGFKKVRSIGCIGKRWFDKSGNTYHSAFLVIDGVMIEVTKFSYGYGDSFVQSCEEYLNIPANDGHTQSLWRYCSANDIIFFKSVADVATRKDL